MLRNLREAVKPCNHRSFCGEKYDQSEQKKIDNNVLVLLLRLLFVDYGQVWSLCTFCQIGKCIFKFNNKSTLFAGIF